MGETPDRRPLGELPLDQLTPPPVPQPRTIAQPGASGGSVSQPFAVQQFSVRSRSAPYQLRSQAPRIPGSVCLELPPALRADGEMRAAIVRLCKCSWECPPTPREKRLCQMDTNEHDEYRLLEAMSRRYATERAASNEVTDLGTTAPMTMSLAAAAARMVLEVHFILDAFEPGREVVVGYVALQKASEQAPLSHLALLQVYVEPERRRRGFATNALMALFSKTSLVAVSTDSRTLRQILGNLGFEGGMPFDALSEEPPRSDLESSVLSAFPYTFERRPRCENDKEQRSSIGVGP